MHTWVQQGKLPSVLIMLVVHEEPCGQITPFKSSLQFKRTHSPFSHLVLFGQSISKQGSIVQVPTQHMFVSEEFIFGFEQFPFRPHSLPPKSAHVFFTHALPTHFSLDKHFEQSKAGVLFVLALIALVSDFFSWMHPSEKIEIAINSIAKRIVFFMLTVALWNIKRFSITCQHSKHYHKAALLQLQKWRVTKLQLLESQKGPLQRCRK